MQKNNVFMKLTVKLLKTNKNCLFIVDDEIVIKLVKAEVDKCESSNDSYFIQGFPRTKVQALSL